MSASAPYSCKPRPQLTKRSRSFFRRTAASSSELRLDRAGVETSYSNTQSVCACRCVVSTWVLRTPQNPLEPGILQWGLGPRISCVGPLARSSEATDTEAWHSHRASFSLPTARASHVYRGQSGARGHRLTMTRGPRALARGLALASMVEIAPANRNVVSLTGR